MPTGRTIEFGIGIWDFQLVMTPHFPKHIYHSCYKDFGKGKHIIFKEFIDPFRSTSMFGSFSSHTLLSLDSSLASSYLIHHHFPVAF